MAFQFIAGIAVMMYVAAVNSKHFINNSGNISVFQKFIFSHSGGLFGAAIVSSYIFTFLFVLLYIKVRKLKFKTIGLNSFDYSKFYLAVIVALGLVAFNFFYDVFLRFMGIGSNSQVIGMLNAFGTSKLGIVLMGLSIVVLAPILEEILFRGFMFKYLDSVLGFTLGALISAFAFALVHLFFWGIAFFLLFGFASAYLVKKFDSIWPSVFIHFLVNGVSFLVVYLAISSGKI